MNLQGKKLKKYSGTAIDVNYLSFFTQRTENA